MKKLIILIAAVLLTAILSNTAMSQSFSGIQWDRYDIAARTAIATGNKNIVPDSCAALQIGNDTTRYGLLLPRVVDTAIAGQKRGLLVYRHLDSNIYFYNGIKWQRLGTGTSNGGGICECEISQAYVDSIYLQLQEWTLEQGYLYHIDEGWAVNISGDTVHVDSTVLDGRYVRHTDTAAMLQLYITELEADNKYLQFEIDGDVTNELELPNQTGQAGKFLKTNGSTVSWENASGSSGVSSISSPDNTLNFTPSTGTVAGTINLALANTWKGTITEEKNNLQINTVDGIILQNIASASNDVNNQQYSPALRFRGTGYKYGTPGASQPVEHRIYEAPRLGLVSPTAELGFEVQVNNVGWTRQLTMHKSNNGYDVVTIGATPASGNSQFYVVGNATIGQSWGANTAPVNGLIVQGQTGIGTATVQNCAKLEVTATSQGFLPPRMSTEQRNVISSPVPGLIIWNTSSERLEVYKNGSVGWQGLQMIP